MIAVQKPLLPLALAGGLLLGVASYSLALTVRSDRWLMIADLIGDVQFTTREQQRRAERGDRLASVGDTLVTASNASARLAIDEAIGSVTMAQNSHLQVQTLSITQNGGRVTELAVVRGQVRLRIRPFTSPESRLEIRTPAGISGVRGTDFGITVQPDGQTAIATESGGVTATAQGETVLVGAGLQSIIRPGAPPTPAQQFQDDPTLYIEELSAADGFAKIVGYTDPVNIVEVDGEPQALSLSAELSEGQGSESSGSELENAQTQGRFNWEFPLGDSRRIQVEVITPLGTQRAYELVVP